MATAWILFHETNSGHGQESDGYVEAVYATEAAAEAAKLEGLRTLLEDGAAIYWNPDTGEECIDWTDDFRVIPYAVQEAAADD